MTAHVGLARRGFNHSRFSSGPIFPIIFLSLSLSLSLSIYIHICSYISAQSYRVLKYGERNRGFSEHTTVLPSLEDEGGTTVSVGYGH